MVKASWAAVSTDQGLIRSEEYGLAEAEGEVKFVKGATTTSEMTDTRLGETLAPVRVAGAWLYKQVPKKQSVGLLAPKTSLAAVKSMEVPLESVKGLFPLS